VIFSTCVNSLNPVYSSGRFNPCAYFQSSNITLLAIAFALIRKFPPWIIYIQETIQVTQCKYFWIAGDVIVQNHIHFTSPIPRMNLLGMGCWKKLLFSIVSYLTEEANQKINEVWFAWNCAFSTPVLNKSTDILWVLSCLASIFNSPPWHLLLN